MLTSFKSFSYISTQRENVIFILGMDKLIGRERERKALFMEMTDTARGPVHTFITPMGIARGLHSSIVHSQLKASDLFASII